MYLSSVRRHLKVWLLSSFCFDFPLSPARMCLTLNTELFHNSGKEKKQNQSPTKMWNLDVNNIWGPLVKFISLNGKSPEPIFISSLGIALEIQILLFIWSMKGLSKSTYDMGEERWRTVIVLWKDLGSSFLSPEKHPWLLLPMQKWMKSCRSHYLGQAAFLTETVKTFKKEFFTSRSLIKVQKCIVMGTELHIHIWNLQIIKTRSFTLTL